MEGSGDGVADHVRGAIANRLGELKIDNEQIFDNHSADDDGAATTHEKHHLPKNPGSSKCASTQGFYLPEILELILLHVPELPLLVFQRVNKTWRDMIKTSSLLQRKLFMKANPIPPTDTHDNDDRIDFRWNPFVLKYAKTDSSTICRFPSMDLDNVAFDTFDNPDASWRKMFVCQPADLTSFLTYTHQWKNRPDEEWDRIESGSHKQAGITMDDVAFFSEKPRDGYRDVLSSIQLRIFNRRSRTT